MGKIMKPKSAKDGTSVSKKNGINKRTVQLTPHQKEVFFGVCRITLALLATGAMITIFLAAPGTARLMKWIADEFLKKRPEYENDRPAVEKAVNKILKDRLVKLVNKRDKQMIEITNNGRRQLVEYNIDTIGIANQKWDGRWRIVMFDIPEKMRLARDVLRDKLKDLGFKQVQKSVWVSPYECQNEINFIGSVYGVEQYINYVVAEKADFSEALRKILNV